MNGWPQLAAQFDLPEEIPQPNGSSTSGAQLLQQYYTALMFPFEETFKTQLQQQHRKAQQASLASRQGGIPGAQQPNTPGRPVQPASNGNQLQHVGSANGMVRIPSSV